MKALLLILVAAAATGCAVYPAPYDTYGGGTHRYGTPNRVYDPNPPQRARDQDHDGVPDSRDRDRDGDGIPNRWDAQPSDPRRR